MAVRLEKGLWTHEWLDIRSASIRIWPIRSLKSEYTAAEKGGRGVTRTEEMSIFWTTSQLDYAPGDVVNTQCIEYNFPAVVRKPKPNLLAIQE